MALAYSEFIKDDFLSHCAANLHEARGFLREEAPAAVLLDVQLPDGSGLDLIDEIKAGNPGIPVIVMTSQSSVETAVTAIRNGADDFLEKPFSADRIRTTLQNVVEKSRLTRLVDEIEQGSRDCFEGFIGSSLVMQGVYHMVDAAAPSKATVFITGESGTGKEVMAQAIHNRSPRSSRPFVALNCGAIPNELIESEIFGHIKGAFTGANKERKGAARQANGGTLFLDEVCEMDMDLQVKLLRFLQTERFRPVGSDIEAEVDVRIVCATNRDPMVEVTEGRFREDLYYRLHVISITMPPLRDRNRDIVLIAESLLLKYAEEENKSFEGFTPGAIQKLLAHRWPGNVREMQNAIRQLVVLNSGGIVSEEMLPPAILSANDSLVQTASSEPAMTPSSIPHNPSEEILPLWKVEEEHIARAIAASGDSIPKAAALLEVSPSTLYRKLNKSPS